MRDDMYYFTVTLEGLGEPYTINCGMVTDLTRMAYDGGRIIDRTVEELTMRLGAELYKRLREAEAVYE